MRWTKYHDSSLCKTNYKSSIIFKFGVGYAHSIHSLKMCTSGGIEFTEQPNGLVIWLIQRYYSTCGTLKSSFWFWQDLLVHIIHGGALLLGKTWKRPVLFKTGTNILRLYLELVLGSAWYIVTMIWIVLSYVPGDRVVFLS